MLRAGLYLLLICIPLPGIGAKPYVRSNASYTVQQKPVPSDTIKKKSKPKASTPDTINVNYENGKLTGSDNMSKDQLRELSKPAAENLIDKLSEHKKVKGSSALTGRQSNSDSLKRNIAEYDEIFASAKAGKIPVQKIHSRKKLQAMYDSAGIGKADTLVALARSKKNISEGELLEKINSSVGGNGSDVRNPPEDLSKYSLQQEALQELAPLSGRKLKPDYRQLADTLLRKKLLKHHADSIAFPDSITHRAGAKIIPYTNQHQLDSLQDVYKDYPMDSLYYMPSGKYDSIRLAWMDMKRLRLSDMESLPQADSAEAKLRKAISKNQLKQKEITDKLSDVPIPQRERLIDKLYFEGIASFNRNAGQDEIRLSPGVGFMLTHDISIGGGVNLLILKRDRKIDLLAGYRWFAKYQFYKQRLYLQVEDWIDPPDLNKETTSGSRHSILAGGGFVLPLFKTIGINGAVLYRVNNNEYADGQSSPWVIRIGLSSIRLKKQK